MLWWLWTHSPAADQSGLHVLASPFPGSWLHQPKIFTKHLLARQQDVARYDQTISHWDYVNGKFQQVSPVTYCWVAIAFMDDMSCEQPTNLGWKWLVYMHGCWAILINHRDGKSVYYHFSWNKLSDICSCSCVFSYSCWKYNEQNARSIKWFKIYIPDVCEE